MRVILHTMKRSKSNIATCPFFNDHTSQDNLWWCECLASNRRTYDNGHSFPSPTEILKLNPVKYRVHINIKRANQTVNSFPVHPVHRFGVIYETDLFFWSKVVACDCCSKHTLRIAAEFSVLIYVQKQEQGLYANHALDYVNNAK